MVMVTLKIVTVLKKESESWIQTQNNLITK